MVCQNQVCMRSVKQSSVHLSDREGEVVLADGTHINDIPTAIKHSVAYTSKDRDNESVVLNQGVGDNICFIIR